MGPHCNYWCMDLHSKHLLCFCCQHPFTLFLVSIQNIIPFQVLAHVFCAVNPIPSSKIDRWLWPKPIKMSLSPIHVTLERPWDYMGMADRGYILIAEENVLSEYVNRDQDMERVKQGFGDHTWPCVQLYQDEYQTFKYLNRQTSLWLNLIWIKFSVTCNVVNRDNQY